MRSEVEPLILANPVDPQINMIAERDAGLLDARVTIILANGQVVGESDKPLGEMENHFSRPEVQQALLNKEATEIRRSDTLGVDLLYAAVPLVDQGKVIGIVRLASPLLGIQQSLNRVYTSVLVAALAAAVLGIGIALLVTRSTLRPLGALSQSVARSYAAGSTESSKDELGQLQETFRNMSQELRQQINELRAERGKLEAVLANMTDGIIIADAQGMIQRLNPAAQRMFKTDEEKAVGRSLIEVVRQHQFIELWRSCQQSGEQQSLSLEIATERLFVQAIASPLGLEMEGSVLLVFHDLTRVRKLETVRRDFISNVSHDLRTPLASLKALAETLNEGALEDPPAARRFLKQIETEIDNMTQLVHELLELSRIESGRVPIERRSIETCLLLEQAAERMALQAERAGLNLRVDCSGELPQVRAELRAHPASAGQSAAQRG